MKKKLIILLTAGVLIIGVGSILWQKRNLPRLNQYQEKQTIPVSEEKEKNSGLDILPKSSSFRCTYKIDEGLETITYVKDRKIRTEVKMPNGDTNISIYKEDKLYQWNEKEKRGFVILVEQVKEQSQTETKIQEPEKYLEEIKTKYRPECKELDLEENLFTPPADVTFQNLSSLFQKAQ